MPTFYFANTVRIPAREAAIVGMEPNIEIDGELYFEAQNGFMFHVHAVTVIIGQLMIAVFGAIGVVFLPYNLLNDFIFRPKVLSKVDFTKR